MLGWPPTNPKLSANGSHRSPTSPAISPIATSCCRYIDELRGRGVRVVDTELRHLVRRDEHVVGFHVQPLLPADGSAPKFCATDAAERTDRCSRRSSRPSIARPTIGSGSTRSSATGYGSTPSPGRSTSPRRSSSTTTDGRASISRRSWPPLPAVVRPIVRREMAKLILRWTTARGALLDLAANLLEGRAQRLARSCTGHDQRARLATDHGGRGGACATSKTDDLAPAVPSRACQPMVAATHPPPRVRLLAPRAHDVRRARSRGSLPRSRIERTGFRHAGGRAVRHWYRGLRGEIARMEER